MAEHQFGRWVKLNVGGTIYRTTRSTLLKDPNSVLSAMFSGRHELEKDEDGAYSIDRDGELFRYVLNYLRNDELFCPDDKFFRKELLAEARFYALQGMIDCLNRLSLESVILKRSDEHLSAVTSWLPPHSSFSLLFRASTDGKSSESFHSYCDNKGPTLVVAKSETCIMGGFTSQSWTSPETEQFKADGEAFLFTLVDLDGNGPQKMRLRKGLIGGIQCRREYGPSFALQYEVDHHFERHDYYYSLRFWSQGNELKGRFNVESGFELPPKIDRWRSLYFGDHLSFNELEVFQVNY